MSVAPTGCFYRRSSLGSWMHRSWLVKFWCHHILLLSIYGSSQRGFCALGHSQMVCCGNFRCHCGTYHWIPTWSPPAQRDHVLRNGIFHGWSLNLCHRACRPSLLGTSIRGEHRHLLGNV